MAEEFSNPYRSPGGRFYFVEPVMCAEWGRQTIADLGLHPPRIGSLHLEFLDWPGDHLVRSFTAFAVSEPLGRALAGSALSGFELRPLIVTAAHSAGSPATMPAFFWLDVTGTVQIDDVAVSKDLVRLIVSHRALAVLERFPLTGRSIVSMDARER